jgi:Rieske Fe-S protein
MTGGTALISMLDSCTALPLYKTISENRKIKIPVSQFEKSDFLIARPTDYNYDIAVIKNGNSYLSLVMQCTHADNSLRFNGNEFYCNLHGSVFNKTGEVEKGPAEKRLISLKTEVQENELLVTLI